jgi:DNA-directed RNA polymerase specialized sigma24 family protein
MNEPRRGLAYHLCRVKASDAHLLGLQRDLIEAWLASDAAVRTAERYLRWRSVDADPAEICNEAWVRLNGSMKHRDSPLPAVTTTDDAAAYCARVIDNLVRDRRRAAHRRRIDPLDDFQDLATGTGVSTSEERVLDRMLIEQLLHVVADMGTRTAPCEGCPRAVVVATALEVVHMVLAGDEGGPRGREWMDQHIHTALARVDSAERTERAWDKRKSRCGRCVVELLGAAMAEVTGDVDER